MKIREALESSKTSKDLQDLVAPLLEIIKGVTTSGEGHSSTELPAHCLGSSRDAAPCVINHAKVGLSELQLPFHDPTSNK